MCNAVADNALLLTPPPAVMADQQVPSPTELDPAQSVALHTDPILSVALPDAQVAAMPMEVSTVVTDGDPLDLTQFSHVFIELCCGTARLSFELRNMGFQVLAIDHSRNRFETKVRTICLDLGQQSTLDFVFRA